MISTNSIKPTEVHKSWKKVNEERKALKKQRKQEKLLRQLEKSQAAEKERQNVDLSTQNKCESKTNPSTISIAVPGSILENAQSVELRTYVAGQIARAACIFRASEVIVFDDIGLSTARETKRNYDADNSADDDTSQTVRSSCLQLARILQYLECPQYLRKFFFPLHKDLKYSGLLNPLDAPHHLRQHNIFRYREGIVTEKQAKPGHSYVNVGLLNDVLVDKALTAGIRVTVKLEKATEHVRKQKGFVVGPEEPRRETGVYWGYTVRVAHSMSEIFTKSPYKGGYDLTVGTSDRGKNVQEVPSKSLHYNHMLLVFGGLQGLETALSNDDKLKIDDPELLFDHYLNVLPRQGSRTIRTEEAMLIAMAAIQEKLNPEFVDAEEEIIKDSLPRSVDTGGSIPRPAETKMARKRKRLEEKQHEIDAISQQQKQTKETIAETTEEVAALKEIAIKKDRKVRPNPFKKEENPQLSHTDLDSSSIDVGFEIVPADKTNKKTTSNSDNDLSRFD